MPRFHLDTRGGLARPQGRHRAKPKIASYWPPAYRKRTGENAMPRLESGLRTRTHGVRPSEKIAFRVIRGFSPQGHLALDNPRGAPLGCTGAFGVTRA